MKRIYIVNELASSKENGIGTYIRELLCCLSTLDVDIYLLSFNSVEPEFLIKTEEGITEMLFPQFPYGYFMNHSDIINGFLQIYIPDSLDNIFILNHSPCINLLTSIRRSHPLSKVIFVIHNFFWTSGLLGDIAKMRILILNRHRICIKKKYHYQLERYDIEKSTYEMSDAVVCLSKDTLGILRNIYNIEANRIYLIPNGLREQNSFGGKEEKRKIREELHISTDERILLFVGRLTEAKGVNALLKALYIIVKKYSKLKLVLAGSIKSSELLQSEHEGIAPNIIFLGQLSSKTLRKWYTISDIGVIPSYCEQCSYVGIEMLMFGLPIVASNAFGVKNMFRNNVDVRIAEIGNRKNNSEFAANLAKTILELLESEQLCENLSTEARKAYNETYNIQKMKKNYGHLIRSLSEDNK